MQRIVCPHKKFRCGIKSPEIGLYMGQTLTLEIDASNNYDPTDLCYYHFYAIDLPTEADPLNLKYLQIYITSIQGLNVYVGSAENATVLDTET